GFAEVATVSATSLEDTSVAADTAYLYRVIALDSTGTFGVPSAPDLAMTVQFSSDPNRVIRAAHINDLRDAIDDLRAAFGLGNASYTRAIAAGKKVKAFDLTEMRSAVDAARSAAGLPAFAWAEAIVSQTPIAWSHWRELQMAIGAIPADP
ncbi:MAG TPA: hypothetical protein VF215_02140, partial [Thermoanaerobaculia bacterium]